jgi:hypothetical protein
MNYTKGELKIKEYKEGKRKIIKCWPESLEDDLSHRLLLYASGYNSTPFAEVKQKYKILLEEIHSLITCHEIQYDKETTDTLRNELMKTGLFIIP